MGSHQAVPAGEISLVPCGASDAHGSASRPDDTSMLDGKSPYAVTLLCTPVRPHQPGAPRPISIKPRALTRHAIIATVCAGAITQFRAAEPEAAPGGDAVPGTLGASSALPHDCRDWAQLQDAFEPCPAITLPTKSAAAATVLSIGIGRSLSRPTM